MTTKLLGLTLLMASAVSAAPAIPASGSAATASNKYVQGAGVVNPSATENYLDFTFSSGHLQFGDQIGFFIFDKTKPSASSSDSSEYDCGVTKADLKSPLLTVSPSASLLNSTHPTATVKASQSPVRSPYFGGLANGRYKLCYCVRPPASASNPTQECRPSDFKYSVGVYFFYDVPELKQKRAVNSRRAFARFSFELMKHDAKKTRVVIADKPDKGGCGNLLSGSFASQPAWSATNAGGETSSKVELELVASNSQSDQVAYHTPNAQAAVANIEEGVYPVCLCDATNIGMTGGSTSCDAKACTSASCTGADFPVEIATLFVHDLVFWHNQKTYESMPVARAANVEIAFKYSKPSAVFSSVRHFWFAKASLPCGQGTQSAANAGITQMYNFQPSQYKHTVDFSQLEESSVLDPFRLCAKDSKGEVLDLNNIAVMLHDVTVTPGDLTDKISDNSQNGIAAKAASASTKDYWDDSKARMWASENFVDFNLTWTNGLLPGDQLYAIKSEKPCSFYDATDFSKFASPAFTVPSTSVKKTTMVLNLEKSLHSGTTDGNPNLFSEYALCVRCNGCSAKFGRELGYHFRVLAGLHVYSADKTFGRLPHRFNRPGQEIIITSGAAPSKAPLFKTTDRLWFKQANKVCGDSWTFGSDRSYTVSGVITNYDAAPLVQANKYTFDFGPVGSADGKLFRLCVSRDNIVYDFPGCTVNVLSATFSPTPQVSSPTPDNRKYTAKPVANQLFTLKAVTGADQFNKITWKFTGAVQSEDKLSIVAAATTGLPQDQCAASARVYYSIAASVNGLTSAGSTISGFINGMSPGQYALCYCNVGPNKERTCRTQSEFRQFAGIVYFDGAFEDAKVAVPFNTKTTIELKMSNAGPHDRMMLVNKGTPCGSPGSSLVSAVLNKAFSDPHAAADATLPYVLQTMTGIAIDRPGEFDICYCWSARYTGSAAKATRKVGGIDYDFEEITTDATNCGTNGFEWERKFGVKVGSLVVHDVALVTLDNPSFDLVTTSRLAVRRLGNQKVVFSSDLQVLQPGSAAWFMKASKPCGTPASSSADSSNTVSLPGFTGRKNQQVATFDFSSVLDRCARRQHGLYNLEEEFFYRLCIRRAGSNDVVDYKNVMVTPTDIAVPANYRNFLKSATATIKFRESCGFYWSEDKEATESTFRFVAADVSCAQAGITYADVAGISKGTVTAGVGATHSATVDYKMYDSSLSKYFLDTSAGASTVDFSGVGLKKPYRLCLVPQGGAVAGSKYTADQWVDYPDVQVFPAGSKHAEIAVKSAQWADDAKCKAGDIGCKCSSNACSTSKFYRCQKDGVLCPAAAKFEVKATCQSINGGDMCVAAASQLYGTRAPNSNACGTGSACPNPGPVPSGSELFYINYDASNIAQSDKVFFRRSDVECGNPSETSNTGTPAVHVEAKSTVAINTGSLSGSFFRLCVETGQGLVLDYEKTGFAFNTQNTAVPTKRTLSPTPAKNKGNAHTLTPTAVNPSFGSNLYAANMVQSSLHILTEEGVTTTMYSKWTNFSGQAIKAGDTLRVYRFTPTSDTTYTATAAEVCSAAFATKSKIQEASDLVMELPINHQNQDMAAGYKAGTDPLTVQFPALAKGYYTACFCRKTETRKCAMSPAGMIYSSAARRISAAGSPAKDASFKVTPVLDYEITPELFDTTKTLHIKADSFYLSEPKFACSQDKRSDFTITLDPVTKGFPLHVKNKVAHATSATDRVYSLCFQDPLLQQKWSVYDGAKSIKSTGPVGVFGKDTWTFAEIGTVYLTDLQFEWEHNGGFTEKRSQHSVARGNHMVKLIYTSATETVAVGDSFWFTSTRARCIDSEYSTSPQAMPASGSVRQLDFTPAREGHFYRLCVRSKASGFQEVKDLGDSFGVWVTDVVASPVNFKFHENYLLDISAKASLQDGDKFFLARADKECDVTAIVGYISQNTPVYNSAIKTVSMGKMSIDAASAANAYIPYRLCVSRTVGKVVESLDYSGVMFYPEGSNYVMTRAVPRAYNTVVKIQSGVDDTYKAAYAYSFTVQDNDVVWFRRVDRPCAHQIWNGNGITTLPSNGDAYGSSRVAVALSTTSVKNGVLELSFNFNAVAASDLAFRLCVEKKSWAGQSRVVEFSDITVQVAETAALKTGAPTTFAQLKLQPTPASRVVVPAANQVQSVFASDAQNQIKWEFSGEVSPADKIAVVKASVRYSPCDGSTNYADPTYLVAATGSAGMVSSKATTPVFGALPAGEYVLCYCHAASSVTKDCSNELGWRQHLGYLFSVPATSQTRALSKLTTGYQAFTLWLTQQTDGNMKVQAIEQGQTCGQVARTSKISALDLTQPTLVAGDAAFSSFKNGLSINTYFNSGSTVGVYNLCFCLKNCYQVGDSWASFGGKIGQLVVHDITFDGQQSLAVHKSAAQKNSVTVNMKQTLFTASDDSMWFTPLVSCGDGSHTPSANYSKAVPVPASGSSLEVDYSLFTPSTNLNRLCVKSKASGDVLMFDNLGLVVTDVELSETSPLRTAASSVKINYKTGLAAKNANRVVFFRDVSKSCDSATVASATAITKDTFTSSSQQLLASGNSYSFDFSTLPEKSALRMCVALDLSASPKEFLDLSVITLYPAPVESDFTIATSAVLKQDNFDIRMIFGGNVIFQGADKMYLRHIDHKCTAALPAAADNFTSSVLAFAPQVYPVASASKVDLAAVGLHTKPLRLCIVESLSGKVLDWSSKRVYMTDVAVSTKVCRNAYNCKVRLKVSPHQAYFTTGYKTQIWFQAVNDKCLASAPGNSGKTGTVVHSRSVYLASLDGEALIDFSGVTPSLSNAYKLCALSSQDPLAKIADLPSVSLKVLDVELTRGNGYEHSNSEPITKYVFPSRSTAVEIKAAAASMPINSVTWFVKSSLSCGAAPIKASANNTDTVTITKDMSAGQALSYDFSLVDPQGLEQLPFRLCYTVNNELADVTTAELQVLRYSVSRTFVEAKAQQTISIEPGRAVGFSHFIFCKKGVECKNTFTTTSNRDCSGRAYYIGKDVPMNFDFSNVDGNEFRLCAIRNGYSGLVDLSLYGVYIGSVQASQQTVAYGRSPVTITYEGLLSEEVVNGNAPTVWFAAKSATCSLARAASSTTTNPVAVKASPFTGEFDFSQLTKSASGTQLRLCALVKSSIKDYGFVSLTAMEATLSGSSVQAQKPQQELTVSYSSVSALGGQAISAWMSSDANCASASAARTPAVASVSGQPHSFDFSQVAASSTVKYHLCLSGKATVPVPFASVYVTDVALSKATVVAGPKQVLEITSAVSLVSKDVVWFSTQACSAVQVELKAIVAGGATASALSSDSVEIVAGQTAYEFDFSKVTPSLNPASMCVSRSGSIMRYSSANVVVGKLLTAAPTTTKPTAAPTARPTAAPSASPTAKPTTAAPTAKPTSAAPTPKPDQCAGLTNKQASCSSAGYSQYCEGKYAAWMGLNCPLLCCEAKKEAESPQDCSTKQDTNQNCPGWAKYCTDSRYAVFMKGNCAKTCCSDANKCADAKDANDRCPVYGAKYCVDKTYSTWMQSNCAAKCCADSAKCEAKSDLNEKCPLYATKYCTDPNYSTWMNTNCAAHCCHAEVDASYAK